MTRKDMARHGVANAEFKKKKQRRRNEEEEEEKKNKKRRRSRKRRPFAPAKCTKI
jgi:hypothetical protein